MSFSSSMRPSAEEDLSFRSRSASSITILWIAGSLFQELVQKIGMYLCCAAYFTWIASLSDMVLCDQYLPAMTRHHRYNIERVFSGIQEICQ